MDVLDENGNPQNGAEESNPEPSSTPVAKVVVIIDVIGSLNRDDLA